MKRYILLALLFFSCTEPKLTPSFSVRGEWYAPQSTPGNYKVLEFRGDGIVRISYRRNKRDLITHIGEFEYLEAWPEFVIYNSYHANEGRVKDFKLEFGNEIFER
jgi:hypothetical protein